MVNNIQVSKFLETQNKPTTQFQREGRIKVTTPDGKERIFSNEKTANEFISRVDGNYQKSFIGPLQPQSNPLNDKNSFQNFLQTPKQNVIPAGSLTYQYGGKALSLY